MTPEPTDLPQGRSGAVADDEAQRPVVRDRRRLDPETGRVREPQPGDGNGAQGPEPADDTPAGTHGAESRGAPAGEGDDTGADAGPAAVAEAERLAAERLADLQRLQAEYVNYRRRVDRDRDVAREAGVAGVLEALLPVLDDLHLARRHGDLSGGPFAAIAEKLETTLTRLGLTRYGEDGEPFDPTVHEALMHQHSDEVEVTTVTQVMQPGYRVGTRVLRPARVAVADPQ